MQSGISHMHGVEASSLVIQLESQYQGGPSLWGVFQCLFTSAKAFKAKFATSLPATRLFS
eukprot:scaffold28507_cov18-Tisochrysis_lutea.AAC.1